MTETVLHTPLDFSAPVKAGRRRFWKQILPVKKINYKGQEIDFDRKFHMDLAQSFADEAFDQVPVVFADSNNGHNMDPRNFGGDVLDVQTRKDGTWALIEADRAAAKAIQRNPKLGVSARIRQGVEKADGRTFSRAIEHVLLTMNPRVTGMQPWQAVDLSDEDADIEVVDLTAETFEQEHTVGKSTTKTRRTASNGKRTIDLSALSDEQFQSLLDLAEEVDEDVDPEDLEDDLEDEGGDENEPKTRKKRSKTKITVEEDSEDNGDDDEGDEDENSTDLSDSDRQTLRHMGQMRIDLAEERWKRARADYVRSGVPPFLLDLAEPILSRPDETTIDLADGDDVNVNEVLRGMIEGVQGIVDLSDEGGHQFDLSDQDEDVRTENDAFDKAWSEQYS